MPLGSERNISRSSFELAFDSSSALGNWLAQLYPLLVTAHTEGLPMCIARHSRFGAFLDADRSLLPDNSSWATVASTQWRHRDDCHAHKRIPYGENVSKCAATCRVGLKDPECPCGRRVKLVDAPMLAQLPIKAVRATGSKTCGRGHCFERRMVLPILPQLRALLRPAAAVELKLDELLGRAWRNGSVVGIQLRSGDAEMISTMNISRTGGLNGYAYGDCTLPFDKIAREAAGQGGAVRLVYFVAADSGRVRADMVLALQRVLHRTGSSYRVVSQANAPLFSGRDQQNAQAGSHLPTLVDFFAVATAGQAVVNCGHSTFATAIRTYRAAWHLSEARVIEN
jgi:hypothetical protein